MVGIALLGAGIFAREQHLPAVEAADGLELVAIYSRSEKSAAALAQQAASDKKPEIYYDGTPGRSLDDVLARADVGAVVVCLPIPQQPGVIKKALAAGKHVLSEKPVATDVAEADDLVAWHAALPAPAPLWAVGENFRFSTSLRRAAEALKGLGGTVVAFHLSMYTLMAEDNKYLLTEWRKKPEYQGGALLDGGVHFAAALRLLLGAAGENLSQLAGFSALNLARMAPVDTIHAVAAVRGGSSGTVSMSFGTEFKSGAEVEVVTTAGAVVWNPTEVKVVRRGDGGAKKESVEAVERDWGVKAEAAAFAESIRSGVLAPDLAPAEAVKDLELIEGLLQSGSQGGGLRQLRQ